MAKWFRYLLLFSGTGVAWYYAMQLFFVWSGAQSVLANPQYQGDKFIKNFIEYEPLPYMAFDKWFVLKGLVFVGALSAIAFVILAQHMKGGRVKRGLKFGLVHWLLMTPWFEFYLPYNVMHEPVILVLLECALWLCVAIVTGMYMSLVAPVQ